MTARRAYLLVRGKLLRTERDTARLAVPEYAFTERLLVARVSRRLRFRKPAHVAS